MARATATLPAAPLIVERIEESRRRERRRLGSSLELSGPSCSGSSRCSSRSTGNIDTGLIDHLGAVHRRGRRHHGRRLPGLDRLGDGAGAHRSAGPAVLEPGRLRPGVAVHVVRARHAAPCPDQRHLPSSRMPPGRTAGLAVAHGPAARPARPRGRDPGPGLQLRRLHDRDLPRRHPGRARAGQREAAAGAGHAGAPRSCAGSCCRRPSASSSRPSATSSSP